MCECEHWHDKYHTSKAKIKHFLNSSYFLILAHCVWALLLLLWMYVAWEGQRKFA